MPSPKISLKIHHVDDNCSAEYLYKVGQTYLRRAFAPKLEANGQRGFCFTTDNKLIRYARSNDYHFLDRENEEKMKMRLQRLHWVRPILEERVNGTVHRKDDAKKRIYYHQKLNYLIILSYQKSGQLELNSAYRITEKYMRMKMEAMFGI